jgi:hypothetical protein
MADAFGELSSQWIDGRSEIARGGSPMSQDQEKPDDRLCEPEKSSDQEPASVNPPSPKTALERFAEEVQELLLSVDPSQPNDTWEGCGGDAAR